MNILFLIATLGLGGAEKQLVHWSRILQEELGARVCVASFDTDRTQWVQALHDAEVPVMVLGKDQSLPRRILGVVSLAKQNQVDVIHAFSCYLSPLAIVTAAAATAVPASSFRGDGLADVKALGGFYRRPVLSMVKYFTANSQEAIAQVKPQLSRRAVLKYVPNLVTPATVSSGGTSPPGGRSTKTALMVGRLDKNKRIDVFLDALAAVRKLDRRLKGVVVGEGPTQGELMEQARNLGLLPDGVEFLGRLPDVSEHYSNADIFVHLAVSEGTPNVVLEAMAAGLPVITTGAGDLRHIIRPRETGVLVPFDDAYALAESLIELLRSPDYGARLGAQAQSEVLRSFSHGQVKSSLEDFYSTIRLRRRIWGRTGGRRG